jgi:1-deoxy-D-xylulose-5-phosphate synthase
MVIMAAGDEAELVHMVATAAAYEDGPIAFRYPRGEGLGVPLPERGTPLSIGRGRLLREGGHLAILCLGARLGECLLAADELTARGFAPTLADARFAKPLDRELILRLAREHPALITSEEGSIGGFGSQVQQLLLEEGLLDSGRLKLRSMILPDRFIDHGTPAGQCAEAGLDARAIVGKALSLVDPARAGRLRAEPLPAAE